MSSQLTHPSQAFQPAAGDPQTSTWRRAGRSVWRFLENMGNIRARAELLRLAALRDGIDPEMATMLRKASRQLDLD